MKKIRLILLINNMLLFALVLSNLLGYYTFSNSKIYGLLTGVFSLINVIYLIKYTNKNLERS